MFKDGSGVAVFPDRKVYYLDDKGNSTVIAKDHMKLTEWFHAIEYLMKVR